MAPDHYTRRAARLMVERYGEGAGAVARRRALELLAAGDTGGAAACRAMVTTIDELQRAENSAAEPYGPGEFEVGGGDGARVDSLSRR